MRNFDGLFVFVVYLKEAQIDVDALDRSQQHLVLKDI